MSKALSYNQEQMTKTITELEKNINITLENIKQNNNRGESKSGSGENQGWHDSKGNKYGFNKECKIEPSDRWTDKDKIGFNGWKIRAERYLHSAKATYSEGMKELMKYVRNRENPIDLK